MTDNADRKPDTGKRKRYWRGLITRLMVIYIIWVGLGWFIQRRIVFPRHFTQPLENAGESVPGLEKLWVDVDGGKVEAWFIPGNGVSAEHPGPAVIFAHGNAELIDFWPYGLQPYRKLGVSLLLIEFRGYGRSAGSPSQAGITEDFVRFHGKLVERPDVDPNRIVYHGRSIGSGPICALAAEQPPTVMILQSALASLADIFTHYGIPRALCRDKFDNAAILSALDLPVLILHGRHDYILPIYNAYRLQKAAKNPRLVEYDYGHSDFPTDDPKYWADIEKFLRENNILR